MTEQHNAEAIDPDSDSTGGGHSVFEGGKKIFVELLLFSAGLLLEAFALFDGIILLGIRGGDFLSVNTALENLHAIRIIGGELGQRYEFFGEVCHEGWLDEGGFDKFFKDRVSDFEVLFIGVGFNFQLIVGTGAALIGREVEPIDTGFFANQILVL